MPLYPFPVRPKGDGPGTSEQRAGLKAFVRWARGDPRLSAWEERFLASITLLTNTPGAPLPSEKQIEVIERIGYKLGWGTADPPASSAQYEDDDWTEDED